MSTDSSPTWRSILFCFLLLYWTLCPLFLSNKIAELDKRQANPCEVKK